MKPQLMDEEEDDDEDNLVNIHPLAEEADPNGSGGGLGLSDLE
jgi:hypothetical protein